MKTRISLDIEEYAEKFPPKGLTCEWEEDFLGRKKPNTTTLYSRQKAVAVLCSSYWEPSYDIEQTVTVLSRDCLQEIKRWAGQYERGSGGDIVIYVEFPLDDEDDTKKGKLVVKCGHCGKRVKDGDTECRGCGANV